jgi:hypothetical protein
VTSRTVQALKRTAAYKYAWRAIRAGLSICWQSYLWLLNTVTPPRNRRPSAGVVVSMTTHPGRMSRSYLALESIMAQRPRPTVHLWLARAEVGEAALPPSLIRLKSRGLRISVVDQNFRSANKLIHSLRMYPNAAIVVADDDVLYPRGWLQTLLREHAKYPTTIVARTCAYLHTNSSGRLALYRDAFESEGGGRGPSFNLMGQGVGGVLYPPNTLDGRVSDLNLYLRLASGNDDVWFKAMSMLKGVKTRRIGEVNPRGLLTVSGSQEVSLQRQNWTGGFDRSLQRTFAEFDLIKLIV